VAVGTKEGRKGYKNELSCLCARFGTLRSGQRKRGWRERERKKKKKKVEAEQPLADFFVIGAGGSRDEGKEPVGGKGGKEKKKKE